MTMTLNQAGVAVDGILNRERTRMAGLRLMPRGVEVKPRLLTLAPRVPKVAARRTSTEARGLMPDTRGDRTETLFLGAVVVGSVVALMLGAVGTASFSASWNSFAATVAGMIA